MKKNYLASEVLLLTWNLWFFFKIFAGFLMFYQLITIRCWNPANPFFYIYFSNATVAFYSTAVHFGLEEPETSYRSYRITPYELTQNINSGSWKSLIWDQVLYRERRGEERRGEGLSWPGCPATRLQTGIEPIDHLSPYCLFNSCPWNLSLFINESERAS